MGGRVRAVWNWATSSRSGAKALTKPPRGAARLSPNDYEPPATTQAMLQARVRRINRLSILLAASARGMAPAHGASFAAEARRRTVHRHGAGKPGRLAMRHLRPAGERGETLAGSRIPNSRPRHPSGVRWQARARQRQSGARAVQLGAEGGAGMNGGNRWPIHQAGGASFIRRAVSLVSVHIAAPKMPRVSPDGTSA
jgi:hypothetical protein